MENVTYCSAGGQGDRDGQLDMPRLCTYLPAFVSLGSSAGVVSCCKRQTCFPLPGRGLGRDEMRPVRLFTLSGMTPNCLARTQFAVITTSVFIRYIILARCPNHGPIKISTMDEDTFLFRGQHELTDIHQLSDRSILFGA